MKPFKHGLIGKHWFEPNGGVVGNEEVWQSWPVKPFAQAQKMDVVVT